MTLAISYTGFARTNQKFYTFGEEWANAMTHGGATAAAIVGLIFLILYPVWEGTATAVATCTIFGSTLVLLYLCSTLYHAISHVKTKRVLQYFDHSAIYLLIAGTYTPFTLNLLPNWIGISVCAGVWTIALFGVCFQPWLMKKGDKINTILYLAQGWFVLFAFKPIVMALPIPGLVLTVVGGLLYSFGTLFFIWQRLPYHHAIWHCFVVGGSVCHYFAVYYTF